MIIGIGGTTGAGKTTASKWFVKKNFIVINVDQLAKKLYQQPFVINLLTKNLGKEILTLNRKISIEKLRIYAFDSLKKWNKLNELIQPMIKKLVLEKINNYQNSEKNVVIDAQILFTSGLNKINDFNIYIETDQKIAEKRASKNTKLNLKQIKFLHKLEQINLSNFHNVLIINNNQNKAQLYQKMAKQLRNLKLKF